jgi:hypothetical protein
MEFVLFFCFLAESKADYNSLLVTSKCKHALQSLHVATCRCGHVYTLSEGDTSPSSELFVAMMSEIKLAFSITTRLSNLLV